MDKLILPSSFPSTYTKEAIMPECPHCAAHFMSWFPLKDHLYKEGSPCLEKEKREQERIRELKKATGVFHRSPPVTP